MFLVWKSNKTEHLAYSADWCSVAWFGVVLISSQSDLGDRFPALQPGFGLSYTGMNRDYTRVRFGDCLD